MASKVPQAETLVPLYDALEEVRQGFVDLFEAFGEPQPLALPLDLPTITAALKGWKHAAEAFNEACYDLAADVNTYLEDRSERWLESDKGQAYQQWAHELEHAEVGTEPEESLRFALDLTSTPPILTVENADEVLPALPDIPELAWQDA